METRDHRPSVEEELYLLMTEWQQGFGASKRRDILERIHHPDFVWTGADGSRMGREDHISAELESDITNDITEFSVSKFGSAAITVGRLILGGEFRATGADQATVHQINEATAATGSVEVAFTITWILEQVGWQVVAIHLGLVPVVGE